MLKIIKLGRRIKLIWDFRGPDSAEIAKHHAIHLKEYAEKEKLDYHSIDISDFSDMYHTAYIVVNEEDMIMVRDSLKPHRGEVSK